MKTHSVRTASSQALTSDFKSFVFLTDSSESQGTHIPHLLCVLSVRSPRIFSAFLIMKVTFTNPHKTKSKRNFPEFRAQKKRVMGIEPTYPAWKAGVLPLNYTRREFRTNFRKNMPRTGIEPVTRGFSVLCSTN